MYRKDIELRIADYKCGHVGASNCGLGEQVIADYKFRNVNFELRMADWEWRIET
jgi:hypothetical protein